MNLQQFLDRVVAPGNFIGVTAKGPNQPYNRFFKRDAPRSAAGFIGFTQRLQQETWYAVASYTNATLQNNGQYHGERKQENVQALKTFWFDADIKRPGDGKDPARVFSNETEIIVWAKQFCLATGIPRPNLWVVSGYGMHLYWLFEDALDRASWQPYAEALKAALIQHTTKGDASIVADAARVLRPIETDNFKVPGSPAPCYEFYPDQLTAPDYPNDVLLGALKALPHYSGSSAKASSAFAGRQGRPMTANARSGMGDARLRDFGLIADNCAQVRRSLDEGGATDGRQLWHALVWLAWFCEQGREWAHRVSDQHPKYTEAETDKEFDQVERDKQNKDFGPPLCKGFDTERPGICPACPHYNKGGSPYGLGLQAEIPDDLPNGYQRGDNCIERYDGQDKDGNAQWLTLIHGDVRDPKLEWIDKHLRLTFNYNSVNGLTREVQVENSDIETRTAKQLFNLLGIPLTIDNAAHFARLIVAWIDKLYNAAQPTVATTIPTFGWSSDAGTPVGLSVGATCYKTDGSAEPVSGGDQKLISYYQPVGSFEKWQQAVELIVAGAPELQVAVSIAFGAPLMEFADEPGACLAFVGASGRGKSSAFRAGASVWGDPLFTMAQLSDTENYISHQIGQVRAFPVYWDEVKISDRWKASELKELLHKLTQGRDRGRLTTEIKARDSGSWRTLFPFASNDSVISALSHLGGDNSATLLRILEIPLDGAPTIKPSIAGSALVNSLTYNYGHAGREYARFVVTHTANVAKVVEECKKQLIIATSADTTERFFVSGGAAILAGAAIAKKLKLINNLDIAAMHRVIVSSIIRARKIRDEHAPTDPVQVVLKALDEFCDENTGERIITESIPISGAAVYHTSQSKFVLFPPMSNKLPLAYQIGAVDETMRINKRVWRDWCLKRGLSPESYLREMDRAGWLRNRLASGRGLIAANTAWVSARVPVFELNLAHPDLTHHAVGQPVAAGSNVVPLQRP